MNAWQWGPRSPNEDKYIPAATREAVYARDGDACRYCGMPGSRGLDHVFPWAQGGTDDETNLVLSCVVCNSIAGIRVFSEFVRKRDYVIFRRMELGYGKVRAMYDMNRADRQRIAGNG